MWILLSLLAALLFGAAAYWFRQRSVTLRWYEWTLGAIGLALLLFTLQNYFAARAEFEPTAPVMFWVVFGIPACLFLAVALLLPLWRYIRSARRRENTAEPTV